MQTHSHKHACVSRLPAERRTRGSGPFLPMIRLRSGQEDRRAERSVGDSVQFNMHFWHECHINSLARLSKCNWNAWEKTQISLSLSPASVSVITQTPLLFNLLIFSPLSLFSRLCCPLPFPCLFVSPFVRISPSALTLCVSGCINRPHFFL